MVGRASWWDGSARWRLLRACVSLARAWWRGGAQSVRAGAAEGLPAPALQRAGASDGRDSCYVDGPARCGTVCGVGVFYSDGHALNRSAGVDVCAARGASNVAELAAIFAAVSRHPRSRPLRLYTDSLASLRSLRRCAEDGSEPPLPPPGPALCAAAVSLLRLRRAETVLAKVAAHADVDGNRVADALAAAGAEKRRDVLDLPAAFYAAAAPRRRRWATARLELAYLLRDEADGAAVAEARRT